MSLRDQFIVMTLLFWTAVGYLAQSDPSVARGASAASQAAPAARAPRLAARQGLRKVTVAELAAHAAPDNCWIAIDGVVYDLTDYTDLHPSKHQEMEGYCGKDGTRAWDLKDSGKDRGKPHSERAAEFLGEYPQIGTLLPP